MSSLASPNYATSYTLNNVGVVDGSLSYLYSSSPLHIANQSTQISLYDLVGGYRHIYPPRRPDDHRWSELWRKEPRVDRRDTLLYGQLFLPHNSLEALYIRRLSPTRLLRVTAVSDSSLASGGTILALFQNDHGKYSTEYLYSTDSALLGVRGLYNFGPDPQQESVASSLAAPSLFSAGAELYYGILNKSGGLSTGARFTTLPAHNGFPYTMTLTLNPLVGNLSGTYAVKAGENLSLCSRFDFNFYSYESGVLVGLELWRKRRKVEGLEWAKKILRTHNFTSDEDVASHSPPGSIDGRAKGGERFGNQNSAMNDEDVNGVLKARVDQNWRIGLLWEGRFKELLFSVGASLDMKREQIFRGVGLEIQYSS